MTHESSTADNIWRTLVCRLSILLLFEITWEVRNFKIRIRIYQNLKVR